MILTCLILYLFHFTYLTLTMNISNKFNISGVCGFPGEPISATHSFEDQGTFNSGTVVSYDCQDFLNFKQKRTCNNSQWTGAQPKCSYAINNDLKRVVIKDCSTDQLLEDYKQIKQQNNFDRFVNSFSSERYTEMPIRIIDRTCVRWHLDMSVTSYFQFVRIDFATVENVSKSNGEVPQVSASVMKNSVAVQCQSTAIKQYRHIFTNKWIEYGHKYHYYFQCQANQMTDKNGVFIIETSTRVPTTIDLVRFSIAKNYGTVSDPACGIPEIPYGVNAVSKIDNQLYELFCDEPYFVNATSVKKTQVKCTSNADWTGTYPKCRPQFSCADSNTFKADPNVEIISIDNVFYYNQTLWYAVHGSVVRYLCRGQIYDSNNFKTKRCIKMGQNKYSWDKNIECNTKFDDLRDGPTAGKSIEKPIDFIQLIPIYAIAAFTSFVIIVLAIIGLVFLKKRNDRKEDKNSNEMKPDQYDSQTKACEVIGWVDTPTTERKDLGESESIYRKQNQYQSEAIYDVPPNRSRAISINYDKKYWEQIMSEPIYDEPKRRTPKPD